MADGFAKTIYLVRHAQAEHNIASDWTIEDAPLSRVGRGQAAALHPTTEENIQQRAQLLVTSPLRRAMETTLLGFPELKARLEAQGKPAIVLDLAQEVEDLPCDTPLHPPEQLASSNDGMFLDAGLDFSSLSPDYASKQGIFHPDNAAERGRQLLAWLRNRPEREIVLVAHGDILRYMVDGYHSSRQWRNAEVREFGLTSNTEDAQLIERGSMSPIMFPSPPSSTYSLGSSFGSMGSVLGTSPLNLKA